MSYSRKGVFGMGIRRGLVRWTVRVNSQARNLISIVIDCKPIDWKMPVPFEKTRSNKVIKLKEF